MPSPVITVGVLALQGAFREHLSLLEQAAQSLGRNVASITPTAAPTWSFIEVRTPAQLALCAALIIPGGESTTMTLVAARSGLLEPLRDFVKVQRRPTWGTCAGLILLAESANRTSTKRGGQELIGGLDVRVRRNFFGRQTESFERDIDLPFLGREGDGRGGAFRAIFIRAPVVERVLRRRQGEQVGELEVPETILAPSRRAEEGKGRWEQGEVEVLARLPRRVAEEVPSGPDPDSGDVEKGGEGEDEGEDIITVRQGNVFGTSFHPELTGDSRIHEWWLRGVLEEHIKGGDRGQDRESTS